MEPDCLHHVHAGANGMLQRGGHQREYDVGFVGCCLNIHNSETAKPELLLVLSLHDQIAGKAAAFWKCDDDSASGFQSGTELPSKCVTGTDRHQPIAAPAEQFPHRVETLIEAR